MAVDVLRAIGEAIGAVRDGPEANRPPGVVYAKCVLKYSFGGAWAFGTAYILGKYNADPEQMINIFQKIALPAGVILLGMSTGCLKLSLRADSLSGLKELWKHYTTGVLREALSQALLTPDLRQFAEEGKNVELDVQIDERIYREAWLDLMVKSVIKAHQGGRNTSLSRRRCQSESNINILLTASLNLKELSPEEKPHKERQELKREEFKGEQETQPKLKVPDLSLPQTKAAPSLPTVLYLNIDDQKVFVKVQSRSKTKGPQQGIVNGKVLMLAKSKSRISAIKVWFFREPEAAKLCHDEQGRHELPVSGAVTLSDNKYFQMHFFANIDDIYAGTEGPFYALSRVDTKRRNVFQLSSVLYFKDGTKSEEFFSKPFRIITKPRSEAAISSFLIPATQFGHTHTEVHTLVCDRVFASKVRFRKIQNMMPLDFSAAKSIEKSSTLSKLCTDLVRADYLIAQTIVCESFSTSSASKDFQGPYAERAREWSIKTRSTKRQKTEGTAISSEFENPEESTSNLITRYITVERLIARCLIFDEMECSDG